MAPGISPPPAVYGVPTSTYTYVLGDSTLAMHGAKKSKKGGYPTAQDETTLRWSLGECRAECIVTSFSGADPTLLLEQLKQRWKLIQTYDVLFIVCKFNGAVKWVDGVRGHPDDRTKTGYWVVQGEPDGMYASWLALVAQAAQHPRAVFFCGGNGETMGYSNPPCVGRLLLEDDSCGKAEGLFRVPGQRFGRRVHLLAGQYPLLPGPGE